MVTRAQRGYTMLEIVMVMAIFGIFLMVLVAVTADMRGYEKRMPVNFMTHPQVMAVLSRMRHDVNDAWIDPANPDPYPEAFEKYKQSNKTLIIKTFVGGGVQTVIWDFSTAGEVHRISYNVGVPTEWIARGLPDDFYATLDALEIPNRPFGVRVRASDKKGMLSVDEYLQPRAHP